MASLKRLLVGSPIRTARLAHERLTKKTALAVFSSDALSSTAYATEEILLVLAAAYVAPIGDIHAFSRVIPITIGIATLLIIVTISYRQTIHAYPSGGGRITFGRLRSNCISVRGSRSGSDNFHVSGHAALMAG